VLLSIATSVAAPGCAMFVATAVGPCHDEPEFDRALSVPLLSTRNALRRVVGANGVRRASEATERSLERVEKPRQRVSRRTISPIIAMRMRVSLVSVRNS
jgi:hypothetical protein